MNQLSIDLAAALRDVGMQQAIAHAESDCPGWTDLALAYLKTWCLTHGDLFTAEDVVDAYAERADFVQPAQTKAWGSVMQMAARRGYMRKVDHEGKRRKGHCSPCPRYQSLIDGKRATEVE
jgi:hypothetical protein